MQASLCSVQVSAQRGHGLAYYQRRLQPVLHYIAANLDQPLGLDCLAARAHFSAFHFQRIFSVVQGESPADYVQRVRLEHALQLLQHTPRISLLSIALEVGYQTESGLAKAFRRQYGLTIRQWRQQQARPALH